jgi:hypothetical protein
MWRCQTSPRARDSSRPYYRHPSEKCSCLLHLGTRQSWWLLKIREWNPHTTTTKYWTFSFPSPSTQSRSWYRTHTKLCIIRLICLKSLKVYVSEHQTTIMDVMVLYLSTLSSRWITSKEVPTNCPAVLCYWKFRFAPFTRCLASIAEQCTSLTFHSLCCVCRRLLSVFLLHVYSDTQLGWNLSSLQLLRTAQCCYNAITM